METSVRSVSHAFSILRTLSTRGEAQTLTDIARATELSPSSCLNLIRTLVSEGAIALESGKRYRLAADWTTFPGLAGGAQARLLAQAEPLMKRLAHDHDVAVGLWNVTGGERLELIALQESDSPLRIHMMLGQRQPLAGGSTGRALAAHRGTEATELQRQFTAVRWRVPMRFDAYQAQVADARHRGFAVDDGFAFAGICSVACALDITSATYCLSASTFSGSRDTASVYSLGSALCALASALTSTVRQRGFEPT